MTKIKNDAHIRYLYIIKNIYTYIYIYIYISLNIHSIEKQVPSKGFIIIFEPRRSSLSWRHIYPIEQYLIVSAELIGHLFDSPNHISK
jgi:hypothetical protein